MSATGEHAYPKGGSPPEQRWTKAGPIAVSMPADDVHRLQETQEVTAAEPAPLGLFGFAAGTIAIGYVLSGFTALVPGFTLSGLGLVGEPEVIGHIGGYWLIAPAVLAFYAAGALVINSVHRRAVRPLFGKA